MDPQQILFTQLLIALREAGYDVYDGHLPPETVPYPFIYLGDSQTVDSRRKGVRGGTVYQTIHIYHNDVDTRGTLSAMILSVKEILWRIENDEGWLLSECSTEILPDNSTSVPLLHGVINAGFSF